MTSQEVANIVKDNDTIMLGGFGKWGFAYKIIEAMNLNTSATNLSFILNSSNEKVHKDLEQIFATRCKHITCSFMRNSPEIQKLYQNGNVNLIPQGNLAESIRMGGIGIPAYYTPIGVGTKVEENKEVKFFEEKKHILERALKGDIALFRATKVDSKGNCFLRGATKNFSPLMALACKKVYVEAEEYYLQPLDSEIITIPGILIDGIVKIGDKNAD